MNLTFETPNDPHKRCEQVERFNYDTRTQHLHVKYVGGNEDSFNHVTDVTGYHN